MSPPTAAADRATPHPGYRPCVGLVLINREGLVFLGERRGSPGDVWQMPQGGIDPGETPAQAAWRELHEEAGTDRAELVAESRGWYAYDLPEHRIPRAWGGGYRGQTQKWFAFRFTGDDADIDLDRHVPEFARWRWATPAEAVRLVWFIKRPVYRAVFAEFAPLLA